MKTTPSDDPKNDEYDDLVLMGDEGIAILVERCREAEGLLRSALPFLSTLARTIRVIEGEVPPALVAVGGRAKQIKKVMDEYGDEKRKLVG